MSRRLRVLSITKSTGGLARYNLRLCQFLDRDLFEVDVACLSENNAAYAAELAALGIRGIPMEMERFAISLTGDLRLSRQLHQLIRKEEYDVIIGHGSKAGFLARFLGRLTKTPSVYRLATMSFVPRIHGKKAYIYRELERLGAWFGGQIVTINHTTRDELIKQRIASEDRITTIYTGIDVHAFSNPLPRAEACQRLGLDPNRLVVGWAARLDPQKAPLAFVEMAAKIVAAVPDVQIFMAGEGALEGEVEALIDSLGIRANVIRSSWQKDVHAMLSAFDVYILGSLWEGLPQSLLEAMSMGLPAVATSVDGTAEVMFHGTDGYLVEVGEWDEMAQYAIDLLQNAPLREKIGAAARKRVLEYFNTARMIAEWQTLLTHVAHA